MKLGQRSAHSYGIRRVKKLVEKRGQQEASLGMPKVRSREENKQGGEETEMSS
jgi:hypothetical protein